MTQERGATAGAVADSEQVQEPLAGSGQERSGAMGVLLGSSVGRNLGLVVALITSASWHRDRVRESASSTTPSQSCDWPRDRRFVEGMTFVITEAASTVVGRSWHCRRFGDHPAPNPWRGEPWTVWCSCPTRRPGLRAIKACGVVLRSGAFIATLAMLAAARGLAESSPSAGPRS